MTILLCAENYWIMTLDIGYNDALQLAQISPTLTNCVISSGNGVGANAGHRSRLSITHTSPVPLPSQTPTSPAPPPSPAAPPPPPPPTLPHPPVGCRECCVAAQYGAVQQEGRVRWVPATRGVAGRQSQPPVRRQRR